jgi:hypothetical protein
LQTVFRILLITQHAPQEDMQLPAVPIDQFLRTPVGTMRAVLTRQIMLSPEQQAEAVRQLQMAYAEYLKSAAKPK